MEFIKSSDLKHGWLHEDGKPQLVLHYNVPRAIIIPLQLGRFPSKTEVVKQVKEIMSKWSGDGQVK